jgi:hypothetical protein
MLPTSALLTALALLLVASPCRAQSQLRAEKVDFARLPAPNNNWSIHADRDSTLARFIRANTSVDLRMAPHTADPSHLDQMCGYPFIYAKDLRWVTDPAQLANLAEYLRRGGFLCVDACANGGVNPDMELYLRANCDIFRRILPEAEIVRLPETHGIYTCFFKVTRADIYTEDMGDQTRCANYALYGVFVKEHMVSIISMYGLECGWPQTPMRAPGCMKLMANMYVYAMTVR